MRAGAELNLHFFCGAGLLGHGHLFLAESFGVLNSGSVIVFRLLPGKPAKRSQICTFQYNVQVEDFSR